MTPRQAEDEQRSDSQSGVSLVEVLMALVVLAIILVMITPMVVTSSASETDTAAVTSTDADVAPALAALTSQVSSASVLYSPSGTSAQTNTGVGNGFALLMYSGLPGQQQCFQWRLYAGTALEDRAWNPNTYPTSDPALTWETVAVGVVNSASTPPFALAGTTAPEDAVVDIDLQVRSTTDSPTITVSTAVTAQGVQQGTVTDPCTSTIPPTSDAQGGGF